MGKLQVTQPLFALNVFSYLAGGNSNLAELARIIRLTYPSTDAESGIQLRVLLAETNREDATYDGIDYGGERVAQEVYTVQLFSDSKIAYLVAAGRR